MRPHQIPSSNRESWKRVLWYGLTSIVVLSNSLAVNAQNTTSPERGFQPSASYAIGDIETINTTNGNLMLNVPLGALPAGRGGLSAKIGLIYNSKIWDQETIYEDCPRIPRSGGNREPMTPPYPQCEGDATRQSNIITKSEDGGWRYTYKYTLRLIESFYQGKDASWSCSPQHPADISIVKLQVVFPDGSSHDFRLQGYTEPEPLQPNFFPITPDGAASPNSICNGWSSTTNKLIYYSVDGSHLRLEFEHDATSGGPLGYQDNPWTLYLADGTRVTGGNGPQRIYDRNNNYVEIQEEATSNNYPATKLIDSLGRSLVIEYNASANEDTVRMRSIGNQEITWRVKWKNINVRKSYLAGVAGLVSYWRTLKVVDQIILPSATGQSTELAFTFGYNAEESSNPSIGWGEVNSVTLPSGAHATYQYKLDNVSGSTADAPKLLDNAPTRKDLTYQQEYDGTLTPMTETWLYSINEPYGTSTITAPDGGVTRESFVSSHGGQGWDVGLVYKTEGPDGSIVERLWHTNSPHGYPSYASSISTGTYIKTEFSSVRDAAGNYLTAIKDYNQDKNGNATRVAEYDWVAYGSVPRDASGRPTGIPTGAPLKRVTTNTYTNATPNAADITTDDPDAFTKATAPRLLNAIESSEVSDGVQTLTRSEFYYDNALILGALTQQSRGNLTEKRNWDSTRGGLSRPLVSGPSGNALSVTKQYDTYGNPTLTTDARGVQTELIYGSVGGFTGLYPTETRTALGRPEQRIARQEYDFYSGVIVRAIDVDNNVSIFTEYDILCRPVLVKTAENKPEETHTQTVYSDAERRVIVRSDLNAVGDGKLVSIKHFDQLGRIRLMRQLEDATTQSATDETTGIKVQTRYRFSGSNSYQLTSNSYRAAYSSAANAELTMGWTRSKSDSVGRVVEVQSFNGSGLPAPWSTNASSTGAVTTAYDGIYTVVTDQAGKVQRSKTDALGRLVRIDEPNDINNPTNLGPVDAPVQPTFYTYSALANLTQVNQGTQTRTFIYSSLSLLLSASNPESGTTSYFYDENYNLKTKTDARGITTSYTYDALNRITFRNYSDATPDVTYIYDTLPNGKGRLTSVSNSVSTYKYTGYDSLGRVTGSEQITDGQPPYSMPDYQYDRAGNLLSQTYPSGRVVKMDHDNAGRLSGVKHQGSNNHYVGGAATDAGNRLQYSAHGAIEAMKLGNGLWEHSAFNSRLQPTQIALGSSPTNFTVLRLDYTYGNGNNNGNVESQTITVPTINVPGVGDVPGYTATQNYFYDQVNRLKVAQENNGASWKQTFIYDRYGNRRLDTTKDAANYDQTTPALVGPNPVINPSTNFITPQAGEFYHYDSVGNLDHDRSSNSSLQYDAENHLTKYNNGDPLLNGAIYEYDGDNRRVKKTAGGSTTVYIYNIQGQLVAEYQNSNLPASGGVSYLTNDTLGTPRVITDSSGKVRSRHDYLPFGEEIGLHGGRSYQQGYEADSIKQKFTGYERDIESGLDYAKARYYSSPQGRFTSADPLNIVLEVQSIADINPEKAQARFNAYIRQPQQWNRYAYVANNPLKYVDPTGEELWLTGTEQERSQALERIKALVGSKAAGYLRTTVKCTAVGTVTVVDYDHERDGLAAKGGELGVFISDIIDSKNVVEYRISNEFSTRYENNVQVDGPDCGGGCTVGREESKTGNTQIFVHPNSGNIAEYEFNLKPMHANKRWPSGAYLPFKNDMVDAHEFGHAYANAVEGISLKKGQTGSYDRALQLENHVRARHGLPSRRTGH